MVLSWADIKTKAIAFAQEFAAQGNEKSRANDPINDRAVKKLSRSHTALHRDGYKRHPLPLFLVQSARSCSGRMIALDFRWRRRP